MTKGGAAVAAPPFAFPCGHRKAKPATRCHPEEGAARLPLAFADPWRRPIRIRLSNHCRILTRGVRSVFFWLQYEESGRVRAATRSFSRTEGGERQPSCACSFRMTRVADADGHHVKDAEATEDRLRGLRALRVSASPRETVVFGEPADRAISRRRRRRAAARRGPASSSAASRSSRAAWRATPDRRTSAPWPWGSPATTRRSGP